ncbi:MAG: NAD(P)H-dependent oxidoreductase [Novosphingobium sp.]
MAHDVAVLVGSLRTDSFSLRLAQALTRLAPDTIAPRIVPIGELALYNQDLEEEAPEPWTAFRQSMVKADAVLFVTPEYNRSVPAALKNAIDVGSRPYGKSVFEKRPAAVVSQSPGALGGFGANHALRHSLVFLDMPTLQMPEVYLGHSAKVLGPDGEIRDEQVKALLTKFIEAFAAWVGRFATTPG